MDSGCGSALKFLDTTLRRIVCFSVFLCSHLQQKVDLNSGVGLCRIVSTISVCFSQCSLTKRIFRGGLCACTPHQKHNAGNFLDADESGCAVAPVRDCTHQRSTVNMCWCQHNWYHHQCATEGKLHACGDLVFLGDSINVWIGF